MKPHALQDGLHVIQLEEELLVYDVAHHKAHYLNSTTANIWQLCDGTRDIAQLAALLVCNGDASEMEAIVRLALEQLSQRHLLREAVDTTANSGGVHRREVLKKLAMITSIPTVMTVMARPAFAQMSPTACSSDADCANDSATSAAIAATGGCLQARCVSGNCLTVAVAEGGASSISTGNPCTRAVCRAGTRVTENVPTGTPCVDANGVPGLCVAGNCGFA